MKKEKIKKIKKEQKNKPQKYYSYTLRLSIISVVFLLLLFFGVLFLKKSFVLKENKVINYTENSKIDYKVYLKENDFYEKDYLEKDMAYIASLIDKLAITFDYDYKIDEQLNMNFNYKIVGKLVISDSSDKNVYYEKIYNLVDTKTEELTDTSKKIVENLEINYGEFNNIANNFKNTYGIDTTSKLIIYFSMNKDVEDSKYSNFFVNKSSNLASLSIPLSEKSVNITLEHNNIDNNSNIIENDQYILNNIIYFVLSLILIVLSLVYLVKLIRLLQHLKVTKNMYDKYINKILKEYDRIIVETSTAPELIENDNTKIIRIDKFTELLDVRDNLNLPIMYYIVAKHEKCYFYINSNNITYINIVKRVDIEGLNEKK